MTAAEHDITIEKGAAFKKTLVWKDSNSSAISLSAYAARMHIRETLESASAVVDITSATSAIVIEALASTGRIDIFIDASVTADLAINKGVYDLELYVSANPVDVTRLMEGKVTISPEVTRDYLEP